MGDGEGSAIDHGQAIPPQNERFVWISAGAAHTCGLRPDGTAVCWGHNGDGRASPPRDERFTSISAGSLHTCGVTVDDRAVCWGNNEHGQSDAPGSAFVSVAAGGIHTCGVRTDGTAMCWGRQITYYDGRSSENVYPPSDKFVSIHANHNNTPTGGTPSGSIGAAACGLRPDGAIMCWGNTSIDPPTGRFVSIEFGAGHACGVRSDGAAVCWGRGEGASATPTHYSFASVSAALGFSCGILDDGAIVCWGDGPYRVWRGVDIGSATSPPGGRFALPNTDEPSSHTPPVSPAYHSFDAASVLARFSTDDALLGEERAAAVGEILAYYESGKSEGTRVLELLHTVAPEASIEARRRAADELALLAEDDDWSEADALDAVQHLAEVITGEEVNAEGRLDAANEMVERYETGDLDADHALNLLDTIAPGMSINQRRQAAASLARLAADTDWDHSDRMTAASEVFRLVTGVPLDSEQRIDAAVDLTAVGVKIFDTEDNFDDRDIDNAAELIKQAVSGELTTESVNSILESGN